jgi:site-specific recombinase XerD
VPDTKITKIKGGSFMYLEYDEAVKKVIDHLTKTQFSMSVIYSHLNCYRTFKQYLLEKQLSYSHGEAMNWLQINSTVWKHPKYKSARLSLFQLDDLIKSGSISNNYVYENSSNYDRLPDWSRLLLNDYLGEISNLFGKAYIQQHRITCSEFLIFINSIDIKNVSDINHQNIIEYHNQSNHVTIQAKNMYNRTIRYFLTYLSKKGLVPASLAYSLDRFAIPKIIFINNLPCFQKEILIKHTVKAIESVSAKEYYLQAMDIFRVYLDRHYYSKSVKKVFHQAWRDFYIFLEANNLNYSYDLAENWCSFLKPRFTQWKGYRRAFKLFEQFKRSGDIQPKIVYSYKEDPINTLPEWSRTLLLGFLTKKNEEENSASTIIMYRSSCLRFLKFLDKKNIESCTMISPEIIKEFHVSDLHSTPEGRNAYSARIRGFLDYLSDMGYVPRTLKLAISTECAQKAEIIEILTDDEIDSVYSFRIKAGTPMELRNAAMVMVGLRMGLRASDITNIKMADISWKERTISVQQKKTNKFLKLPMPVDVGNSLYKYILNGRPEVISDYVFVNHRVPYDKLNTSCCCKALNKALHKKMNGFHITRKTFASRMLKNRVNTDTIADSLGHSNCSTVHEYLATDANSMKQCALSLKGIELKGGILS